MPAPRHPFARALVGSAAGLLLAVSLPAPHPSAQADLMAPKSGPKIHGLLVKKSETDAVFNPNWSQNPDVTYEVVHLTPEQARKVDVEPRVEPEFFRRLRARKPGDAKELVTLATWAKDHKLKAHAEMALALALADTPASSEALAAIGGSARFEALRKGNPLLDAELLAMLRTDAAEPTKVERLKQALKIVERAPAMRIEDLERIHRSALAPKGYQEDLPLSLHADRYAGAVYTLFVPDGYDPALTWPLLIGLHGGGPDGKLGDEVVGSGPSAMMFYRSLAAEHGVIVACPTAQTAGWGNRINEDLVRDVIAEIRLTYHVDIDRIHLTGHSMGGYGTWALGPRMAELFATVSPMAGDGDGNVKPLIDTKTPIFIYHSADDFIPVAGDRAAAKHLRETDLDFIYCELDHEKHGCPESVRKELFEFLMPRRNFDPAYKDAWPRSSFAGKVSPDEKTYLGDPTAGLDGVAPPLEERLAELRLSGGRARAAALALAATKPAGCVEGVVKIVKDEKASPYARAEAARLLGVLGDAAALPALRRVVAGEARRDTSPLAAEAAHALAVLKDAGASEALAAATKLWAAYFESKRMSDGMRFSDWERSVRTLARVVDGWADLGGAGSIDLLDKLVVARVFAAGPKVETSDRVPQDPGLARLELARAVARAYAAAKAPSPRWDALLASLAADAGAKAAAEGERK